MKSYLIFPVFMNYVHFVDCKQVITLRKEHPKAKVVRVHDCTFMKLEDVKLDRVG